MIFNQKSTIFVKFCNIFKNRLTDIYRHLYQSKKTGPYQNPNIYPVTKVATLNIKMKKKTYVDTLMVILKFIKIISFEFLGA